MPFFWTDAIPGVTEDFSPDHPDAHVLLGSMSYLELPACTHGLHLCGPCSSALDVAMHLAQNGQLAVWDSVLAVSQWAGRGQLRRSWVSEPGNLFAAWRLPLPPAAWGGLLSVLLGWAFCAGLQEMGIDASVKWPNDILVESRKVGGLLLEEKGDVFLAGLGLNLISCPPDQDLREDRACLAGVLKTSLPDISLFELWLRLVHSAQLRYRAALSELAPAEFSWLVETTLAYLGEVVHLGDHQSWVRGVYAGLDADGGIILRTEDGDRVFHSGSLRLEK